MKVQGDGTYAPSREKPLVRYTQGRGVWVEVETVVRLYFSMSSENFRKLEKPLAWVVTRGLKKGGDDATLKTSYPFLSYLK